MMNLVEQCITIAREAEVKGILTDLVTLAKERGFLHEIAQRPEGFAGYAVLYERTIGAYVEAQVVTIDMLCEWVDEIIKQCLQA